MCIICLLVDFVMYTKTSKWIDNTSWLASVLGIVLVHYMDGTRWNETNHTNLLSIVFVLCMGPYFTWIEFSAGYAGAKRARRD